MRLASAVPSLCNDVTMLLHIDRLHMNDVKMRWVTLQRAMHVSKGKAATFEHIPATTPANNQDVTICTPAHGCAKTAIPRQRTPWGWRGCQPLVAGMSGFGGGCCGGGGGGGLSGSDCCAAFCPPRAPNRRPSTERSLGFSAS